jgi:hypothetical protein
MHRSLSRSFSYTPLTLAHPLTPRPLPSVHSLPPYPSLSFSLAFSLFSSVYSRGDPYFGENPRAVLLAVMDPDREPEYRPAISPQWPAAVQALMQVMIANLVVI